jgi:hypothetical protein
VESSLTATLNCPYCPRTLHLGRPHLTSHQLVCIVARHPDEQNNTHSMGSLWGDRGPRALTQSSSRTTFFSGQRPVSTRVSVRYRCVFCSPFGPVHATKSMGCWSNGSTGTDYTGWEERGAVTPSIPLHNRTTRVKSDSTQTQSGVKCTVHGIKHRVPLTPPRHMVGSLGMSLAKPAWTTG